MNITYKRHETKLRNEENVIYSTNFWISRRVWRTKVQKRKQVNSLYG